jgi:L-gulono-1,4-lactone dehydrogenase
MPLWTNWAGQQHSAPHAIERPASEAELVQAVGSAAERGLKVKAAGSGHSFTDIACTDGVMVHLGRMNRVLDADSAGGLVRVEAGITLHDLGPELARRGLAMENQGDVDPQALAGAISTATHGTGPRFGNLATQIAAMRLVTASGEVLELSEDSDSDAWLAARVGLGALGVISEVTLRCVPLFTLRRVDDVMPLEEAIARFDELADAHDHWEFFTFPYTDVALTRASTRTDEAPTPPPAWKAFAEDVLVVNGALGASCHIGKRFPRAIPALNRMIARAAGRSVRSDHSYRVYANRRSVIFTEMEYAIPRAAATVAIERVMDLVKRRRLPVSFPLEVRVVAPDDAFLSTAHGRETAYVAVHMFRGTEFESYFRGVEAIMDDYGGRPHWGKRHYKTAATLRERYPEWDRFQAVRARLDPDGLFQNDYTERVLGPVGAPAPVPAPVA